MTSDEFSLEPNSATSGGMSVRSSLKRSAAGDTWDVTIVFSRAPDQSPIPARDVEAQLLDTAGRPFSMVEAPHGSLIEVGGSLGTSANALFRFAASKSEPAEVVIAYRGDKTRFRLVPKRQ